MAAMALASIAADLRGDAGRDHDPDGPEAGEGAAAPDGPGR
jgi:hypothetical protein